MIGTTLLNRYEIESELGKGGMGVVYKAHDTLLHRTVAIKFLNTDGIGTEGRSRLIQEARAVAQLNHPNIVSVFDAGETEGNPFIVMEFVPGTTLKGIAAPSVSEALVMAGQICKALDHAHSKGIIHRDLKLENIIVTDSQTLKLMDFGLARSSDDSRMTEEGVLKGTLAYIAPELIQGEPASVQSDLYAFGVILYELLTGHAPFQGTINIILAQHLHGVVAPPSGHNENIPEWVDKLVLQLLAKRPEERHASAKEVLRDIEERSTAPTFTSLISIAPRPKNNLPTQLSTFIGREKEVEQIKGRMEKNRLVTLTGSGGIGKTRLSIQVAAELLAEYPIGVWLVELAPLIDPALVPQSVCATLGVKPEGDTSALDALINYMHEKKILLVVDNCEHLIDACAQLCDSLLHACPELRIIASSREALGLDGENAYRVPSLSLPDPKSGIKVIEESEAVKLFMERAEAVLPEFQMTEANAPAIAQICQRLDGIALAIELAASRVKMLKVEQIASRLDDAFRLLTGGSRTALPRQQTLRALIDWSYNLLPEEEKAFLRKLSVFMGGWTLEAAEAICGNADALDLLTHLVDKSLVSVDLEHGDEPRYYLLETVRQYAREKMVENEDSSLLRDSHLEYFVKTAEHIAPELYTRKMPYWLDYLETEYANLQASLEWTQERNIDAGLRLCNALFRLWQNRGEFTKEGLEWYKKFLSMNPNKQNATRAWAFAHAAELASLQSPTWISPEIQGWFEESLNLARELGDEVCIATVLEQLGFIEYMKTGNFDKSRNLLEQSLAMSRRIKYDRGVGFALDWLGTITAEQSDFSSARPLMEESLLILSRIGELRRWGLVLNRTGRMYEAHGCWNEAQNYYEQALSVANEAQSRIHISLNIESLGSLAIGMGDFDRAISLLEQARKLVQGTPDDKFLPFALLDLGEVARFQGNFEQAIVFFHERLSLPQGDDQKAMAYCYLAHTESLRGEILKARQYFVTGLHTIPTGDDYVSPSLIPFVAYFMVGQKMDKKATSLLGWVDGWDKAKGYYQLPVYQAEFDRYLAQARKGLSESEFNEAWAEGQSMSQEQVLALAMEALQ